MKLQFGKRYWTRAGQLTDPVIANVWGSFKATNPFGAVVPDGRGYVSYRSDGREFNDIETKHDLISEYEEQRVSNKAEKLNKLVDEMPVCNDGKAKIRALVQEITGEKLIKRKPKRGEVWIGCSGRLYIVVDDDNSMRLDGDQTFYTCNFSGGGFVANSVTEYVANGGKL